MAKHAQEDVWPNPQDPVYEVFVPSLHSGTPYDRTKSYLHVAVAGFPVEAAESRYNLIADNITGGEEFLMRRMRDKEIRQWIGKKVTPTIIKYQNGLVGFALSCPVHIPGSDRVVQPEPKLNLASLQGSPPLLK